MSEIIAYIHNDFREKFGIPRQSGLSSAVSRIVFTEKYRSTDAVRGLDGYSYIWLLWGFSKAEDKVFRPTVRPPRLGGNVRMGVFATRSPFRPNNIGLSSVKLISVDTKCGDAPVIYVEGADILDGSPIYDIKPYLAYTDSHPEAKSGFSLSDTENVLSVDFSRMCGDIPDEETLSLIFELIAQDPRPQYIEDPDRVYYMRFSVYDVGFRVCGKTAFIQEIKRS